MMPEFGPGPSAGVAGTGKDATVANPVTPAFLEIAGAAVAALNGDILPQTDVRGYRYLVFQLTGVWSATVTVQQSNDGTTWTTLPSNDLSAPFVSPNGTRTVNGMYGLPLTGARYVRIRATAYVSGTVGATIELTSLSPVMQSITVNAAGTVVSSVADAQANSVLRFYDTNGNAETLAVDLFTYNSANATAGTWDKLRGNFDGTIGITGTAVTSTQTGTDQTNWNGRGIIVVLDMTTIGTGSVTLKIQGKAPSSGKYYDIFSGAAVITNSTNVYVIYPGYPAVTNVSANSPIPRTWRAVVTANNANATTYTVEASVLV